MSKELQLRAPEKRVNEKYVIPYLPSLAILCLIEMLVDLNSNNTRIQGVHYNINKNKILQIKIL